MVMPVSCLIDRLRPLTALLVAAALGGALFDASAPQPPGSPRRPQNQPPKPPTKPAQRPPASGAKAPSAAAAQPAKNEPLPPSQVGIGTLARQAFMVDPQTSSVLLYKEADTAMHPSSMAKMMTIYIVFEELT